MQRGDGCGVGNGFDRGRVDIVVDGVDMPACDVLVFQVLLLLLKVMPRWNTTSGIQQHSTTSIGTQTGNHHYLFNLLTAPTARPKSPVRLGPAPPSKTGSLTQTIPSNPNSSLTRMTPTNLRKTLTHLTQSDSANRIWSLILTYG